MPIQQHIVHHTQIKVLIEVDMVLTMEANRQLTQNMSKSNMINIILIKKTLDYSTHK